MCLTKEVLMSIQRHKIGLDFHGVIVDHRSVSARLARSMFNIHVHPYNFTRNHVVGQHILTNRQYNTIKYLVYNDPDSIFQIPAIEGAIQFINDALRLGHTLYIITSAHEPDELSLMKDFLKKVYALDVNRIHFIGVGIGQSKAQAVADLDYYVDDDMYKLQQIIDSSNMIIPILILFRQKHNQYEDTILHPQMIIADGWLNVCSIINL